MFGDMMASMSEFFYRQHYHDKIKENLTYEQKLDISKRISNLTLHGPIWLDRDTDYIDKFPELEPYVSNVPLTGLYLCSILKGILEDIQGIDNKIMVPF